MWKHTHAQNTEGNECSSVATRGVACAGRHHRGGHVLEGNHHPSGIALLEDGIMKLTQLSRGLLKTHSTHRAVQYCSPAQTTGHKHNFHIVFSSVLLSSVRFPYHRLPASLGNNYPQILEDLLPSRYNKGIVFHVYPTIVDLQCTQSPMGCRYTLPLNY